MTARYSFPQKMNPNQILKVHETSSITPKREKLSNVIIPKDFYIKCIALNKYLNLQPIGTECQLTLDMQFLPKGTTIENPKLHVQMQITDIEHEQKINKYTTLAEKNHPNAISGTEKTKNLAIELHELINQYNSWENKIEKHSKTTIINQINYLASVII